MLKPTERFFTKEIENLGKFVFKYPTLKDEIAADNIAAMLLGENKNPAVGTNNMAVMIGTLKTGIVEAPEGFDLDEIYSYEELEVVYNAFAEKVSSFRRQSAFSKQKGAEDKGTEPGQDPEVLVSE